MREMKVSVIIPAYNSAATIERCLDAILQSTYPNLEIIVVDDGSEDETPQILMKYAERHSNLRVVRSVNQGPSKARNLGMKYITGEYFIFADSDDEMEPKAIECLLAVAEETRADVVCGVYNRIQDTKRKTISLPVTRGWISPRDNWDDVLRYHKMKTSNMFGYLWNKLHRTSFFREKGLTLPDINSMNLEDNVFYLKVLIEEPKFYVTDIVVNNYDVRNTSLTRKYDMEYVQKSLETIRYVWDYFRSKGKHLEQEYMDLIAPLALRLYCFSLVKNGGYEKLTLKKLKENSQYFTEQEAFMNVIRSAACIPALKTIQSFVQKKFFCMVVSFIRKKQEKVFLTGLYMTYPFIRLYLKRVLR